MKHTRLLARLALGAGMMMALGAQTCAIAPPPGGGYYDVPRGSYLASCVEPRIVYGNTLVADCRDPRGLLYETSLRLPCQGDIANENGQLVCNRDDGGYAGQPPEGSYRSSCRGERVERGDLLVAECRDRRGRYYETSLRLPCRGDIANDNGQLVCGRDSDYGRVPDGSYLSSCREAEVVRGDILVAECSDRRGRWVETSLRLPCRADIYNDNGQLACGRADGGYGGAYPPPDGPYRLSCTGIDVVRGDLLIAECRNYTGRYVQTSLQLPCYGLVDNNGGRLVCRL